MGGRDRGMQWLHRCVKHLTSLNKVEGEEGVTCKAALWPLEGTMACTHRCSLSHTTWTEISVLNGKDPWPSRLVPAQPALSHSARFLALKLGRQLSLLLITKYSHGTRCPGFWPLSFCFFLETLSLKGIHLSTQLWWLQNYNWVFREAEALAAPKT